MRRRALARVTALMTPRAKVVIVPSVPGVAIAGPLSTQSGAGELARLMIAATRAMGLPVWEIDLPWPVGSAPRRSMLIPPAGVPLILHVNAPLLPLALLSLPAAIRRERLVIANWAWELAAVPPEWRPAAPIPHEIWVPSDFTARAIEPLAPGRVHIVPPALGLTPPQPSRRDRAGFGLPADAVITLVSFNLASSYARKNPMGAIAAFRSAFGARTDRLLVIKLTHADHAPEDFALIQEAARAPNIRLITETLSGPDRHALTSVSDIVLSPHRAEGFGLVPAEAMLLGKPVVATGWSGNLTFMTRANSRLIDYRLISARDPRGVYRGGVWAEPDIGDAALALRRLADDAAYRAALGARARDSVRATLNGEALRTALRGIGQRVPSPAGSKPSAQAVEEPVLLAWKPKVTAPPVGS
jgi:glycosyltransferase involved in cell wall biosynthesis